MSYKLRFLTLNLNNASEYFAKMQTYDCSSGFINTAKSTQIPSKFSYPIKPECPQIMQTDIRNRCRKAKIQHLKFLLVSKSNYLCNKMLLKAQMHTIYSFHIIHNALIYS